MDQILELYTRPQAVTLQPAMRVPANLSSQPHEFYFIYYDFTHFQPTQANIAFRQGQNPHLSGEGC